MRHQAILVILLVFLAGATIWITNMEKIGIYSVFTYGDLLYCAAAHFRMVFISVIIATVIGVPLGILSALKRNSVLDSRNSRFP